MKNGPGLGALIGMLGLTLVGCGGGSEKKTADPAPKKVSEKIDEALGFPPDWFPTNEKSAEAYRAGKYPEALVILEDYAKAHASFADAELMLGDDYLTIPSRDKTAERENREKSAVHYRRGLALAQEDQTRNWGMRGLLRVYAPEELDRPADAEPVARALVKANPTDVRGYSDLASVLRRLERHAEATQILRDAGAHIADRDRNDYIEALVKHAEASPSLEPSDQRQILTDARPVVDGLLKAKPDDVQGLLIRSKMVAVEAHLEPNPAKRRALERESKRLSDASLDALTEQLRH